MFHRAELQGELRRLCVKEQGHGSEGYSRHKLSSSSSPWAQVRMPSHTPWAGMHCLRSWHKKPVLLVIVTQDRVSVGAREALEWRWCSSRQP